MAAFFSYIAEALEKSPFHKGQQFKLHDAQCQALSMLFSSTLNDFFLVSSSSRSSSSTTSSKPQQHSKASKWTSLSLITDITLSTWWSMCDKNEYPSTGSSSEDGISAILDELQNAPQAITELWRVIKEAEKFLEACKDLRWWMPALTVSASTEACDVHVHDLLWCILGLDLVLLGLRGAKLESRAQVSRQRITQCYAEMEARVSEYAAFVEKDFKTLQSRLQLMNGKHEGWSRVRKALMKPSCKLAYRAVRFLVQKLEGLPPKNPLRSDSFSTRKPPQCMKIRSQDLIFSSPPCLIGRGSYGTVFQASWLGIEVAAKQFDYISSQVLFEYEAAALVELMPCPFIVQFLGWSTDISHNTCYLVLELSKSNLEAFVMERKQHRRSLHMPVLIDIMLQISRGMEYMHSKKIMHRDLKPSNVLVQPLSCNQLMQEGYVRVKLCDFGCARVNLDGFGRMTSRVGTPVYRAPEVCALLNGAEFQDETYSFQADTYSFAMTFAYCLTEQEPFSHIGSRSELQEMLRRGERPELPASCLPVLRELIHKCWSKNPSSRPLFPTITMALRHIKLFLMKTRNFEVHSLNMKELLLSTPLIPYEDLFEATSGFTKMLPNVTLDTVCCGALEDGTSVIVQQMDYGAENKTFWVDISQRFDLRHINIVSLHAGCIHGSNCWFVYKHTSMLGSLDGYLSVHFPESKSLDMVIYYKVAVGVAYGLQYLHARDFLFAVTKESILLGEGFEPQILISRPLSKERARLQAKRLDIIHFGILIEQILSYLLCLDDCGGSPEVSTLQAVKNLCLSEKDASMDEVVDMLATETLNSQWFHSRDEATRI